MLSRHKEKILLVDDERSILDVASEYFTLKGYDVLTATNGREAMDIINQGSIDCCFTDINMPEMDGLELAELIRRKDNSVPVIIMTGYPSLDNTIQTLKNGVADFLIKPVNLNQMELCVQRVLRERKLFAENVLLKNEVEGKARLEKLNGELVAKVEELHILNKIMTDFTEIGTSSDILRRITEMAIEVIGADESRFYVVSDASKHPMEVAATYSKSSVDVSVPKEFSTPRGNGDDDARNLERLIHETAADEIPLLISENHDAAVMPSDIRSLTAVPMKIREKVFGVLIATVSRSATRFSEKDLYYLTFMAQNAAGAIENLALYENIYENMFATLFAFVKAVEARDSYTQKHSNRVTDLAIRLGREIGCSAEEIEVINFAGRLHDIGKIGIRDEILLKPGRLTPDEFEIIKTHPAIGAEIVGQLGMWEREQTIIRHHHERYDGTGYPDGLKGDEIPFLARILSVCDAFDAMASNRVYRQKLPKNEILGVLRNGSGTQFDPTMVDAFLRLDSKGEMVSAVS